VSLEAQAEAYRKAQRWIALGTVGLAAVIAAGALGLLGLGALLFLIF
jgi:hypothetical protein